MSFKKFKTERFLLASIAVLSLFLFVSVFINRGFGMSVSLAEEDNNVSSSSSSESSNDEESENSEGSDSSEDSEGNSEDSASEDSDLKEHSGTGITPKPAVRNAQNTGGTETSEESSSEASLRSVEEASEDSELSEESQEISEESVKYIEGYGDIISKNGNVALVKKNERLFFLIPVEVESQVTLGEKGEVLDEKKSFFNWLLSIFSA